MFVPAVVVIYKFFNFFSNFFLIFLLIFAKNTHPFGYGSEKKIPSCFQSLQARSYDDATRSTNKLYAFRILVPNLKTINLTFGSLSPILYVK